MASKIELNTDELINNEKIVFELSEKLMETINDIDKEIKNITSENCWFGKTSSVFLESSIQIYSKAVENILSLKEANEYKNVVADNFFNAESVSSDSYRS